MESKKWSQIFPLYLTLKGLAGTKRFLSDVKFYIVISFYLLLKYVFLKLCDPGCGVECLLWQMPLFIGAVWSGSVPSLL